MKHPTLFLTVGLPGTGKATAARRIEAEHGALTARSNTALSDPTGRPTIGRSIAMLSILDDD